MKGRVGAMVLVTLLWVAACERLTQPRLGPELVTIEPAAVLVTEVWLQVKTARPDPSVTVVLERDGQAVQQLRGLQDTVLTDSGLMPNRRYAYRLHLYRGSQSVGRTAALRITTMDTTSHAFAWEVIEFPSPYGSGALYDVAIIDENDIWAVGEIYSDSAQPWLPYNAVHWDGQKWELKRITVSFRSNEISPPLEGIFAFSRDDIWVTSGAPKHWDGKKWTQYHLWDMGVLTQDDGGVTRIWGSSPDDIYFAGRGGTIVHYDGRRWRRIESGVELTLLDIWGTPDGQEVWICGWEDFKPTVLLKCEREQLRMIFYSSYYLFTYAPDTFSGGIRSIWVDATGQLYALTWYDLYRYRENPPLIKPLWGRNAPQIWASTSVRGTAANNIFTVSTPGMVWHYNGISWRRYPQLMDSSVRLTRVAVTENLVIAAGYRYVNAVERTGLLYLGRR